jgi:hypothetical protein
MKWRIELTALLRATKAQAGVLVGDQVDIALPVLLLLVGHAVELVGQRAQALGQEPQHGHTDRELAGPRLEERAFGADDVAQVAVLERVVAGVAERILGHEELDPAGRILQRAEARLAHHALEHQPAGHADRDGEGFEFLVRQAAVLAHQFRRAIAGLEVVREGHALAPDRGQLLAALGDQGVVVGGSAWESVMAEARIWRRVAGSRRSRRAIRRALVIAPRRASPGSVTSIRRCPHDRMTATLARPLASAPCRRSASRWSAAAASRKPHRGDRRMPSAPSWSPSATTDPQRSRAVRAPAPPASDLARPARGSDADVVVLATPSGLHRAAGDHVRAAGRHVLSEKPMATRSRTPGDAAGLSRWRRQALRR